MVQTDADPNFLGTVLSTITSPLPLDIVVVYQCHDVGYLLRWWVNPSHVVDFPQGVMAGDTFHRQRFKQLREMYMVREFRPVLCVDTVDCAMEYCIQRLERIVEVEKAKGGLDYLLCRPLIISEMRSPRTRVDDGYVGGSGRARVFASAL